MMRDEGRRMLAAKRARHEVDKLDRFQLWPIEMGRKHYLYHERREGWTSDLPVYLFRCGNCERFSLDYPHGFVQNRYLTCQNCGTNTDFVPWWVPFAELWDLVKVAWRILVGKSSR